MGQSTDAFLFFGSTLEDEGTPEWMLPHPDDEDGDWYNLSKELERDFGVKLSSHQSADCPVMFIAIQDENPYDDGPGGFKCAYRGHPLRVTTDCVGADWIDRLNKAADRLNWPVDLRTWTWWLASDRS